MKLSEAVRAGADWPDVHGPVFRGECCCAIGGVVRVYAKGKGVEETAVSMLRMDDRWPILMAKVPCPAGCCGPHEVLSLIPHLFENLGWSKKAIAEWVEVIENKLETESRQSSGLNDTEAVQAAAPVSGETVKV